MQLSIKDRIVIQSILPPMGNFITQTIKQDLKKKLEITQDEITKYDIRHENGTILWDESKEEKVDFVFTELEEKMIKDSFEKLNNDEKITDQQFETSKMFLK